ncbi:hydrophobic protein [Streptomyces sp. NPDC094447]|uniref:hydrophobic protein n=1 Tax=Streptomyces sp. NPDC094447 TaxID=3366062 RepID=UPI00380B3BE4
MPGGYGHPVCRRLMIMVPLLLVLLLALILFGAGFAVKVLWWVAIAVLVLWLIGFVARPGNSSGRWYRW